MQPSRQRFILLSTLLTLALIAIACGESDPDTAAPNTDGSHETDDDDSPETDDEPIDDGENVASVDTARYSATIRRTASNVPHVLAETLASVGFGYGYAFAEDHLCSLADVVVQVNSEASKYFGTEWRAQDTVYRAIDLLGDARGEFEAQRADVQEMIRAYATGYNTYLGEVGADGVGGYCTGAEWVRPITEYDLAGYYKALTLRASLDPMLGFIFDAAPPTTANTDESALGDTTLIGTGFNDLTPAPETLASNAWAIGPDRTIDGNTMLVGNPHFPWQGALRFYEVHLTVPGVINVYGASLLGSPAVNIGFNESVAWSHTVSAGTRFTAYTLDLVDGDPTSYHYGGETRQMTSVDVGIEVLDADSGNLTTETNTVWFSHYGPVLSFPGVGWNNDMVITVRDGNADNDEIIAQFLDMNLAGSMDDFIAAHAENQGIPWVNTIAASADGRIWYADTSATPNLSAEAITAWEANVETDVFTRVALDNSVVLLDGSDPLFEWVDDPGARDPGLVPFAEMPQLERTDYLFNANDPSWVPNASEFITGVSPLHGRSGQQLSNRTRMNAAMLEVDGGDSGADGLYTYDELAASAIGNRVYTAEVLLEQALAWCDAIAAPDLTDACDALAGWDRHVNLDSTGAHVWREFIHELGNDVWDSPFDAADPLNTPRGLIGPNDGGSDPLADAMSLAVERIEAAGFAVDAPLGELQFADRDGLRIPIHGGSGTEGVSNVVGYGKNDTTSEPGIGRDERVAGSSSLTAEGYPVSSGTSFIYVLQFTEDGPQAQAFLTYGESGDRDSPFYSDQTQRFSDKDWRTLAYAEEAIAADPALTSYRVTG